MRADLSTLLRKRARYGTVVADPPWPERGGPNGKSGWSKSVAPNAHYKTMTLAEIAAMGDDVERLALPDAHLYLWTTNYQLARGVATRVVLAWGFRPLTVLTWRKTTGAGVGQYHRGKTEHLLFAVRGSAPYRRKDGKRVQGDTFFEDDELSFDAPRGKRHSQKPDYPFAKATEVSPGPYLELFAREKRKGWTVWGDEVPA